MTDNTRYYFDGRHYMKLTIEYEECAENPRTFCDNFTHLWIWSKDWYHCDYIGDDDGPTYNPLTCQSYDWQSALQYLVRYEVTDKKVIAYVKSGETHLQLYYDRHDRNWYLSDGDDGYIDYTDQSVDWLIDSNIEELTEQECCEILEKYCNMVILPIKYVDYGSGYEDIMICDYDDMTGFIWTDKDLVKAAGWTDNWKDHGYELCKGDIDVMSLYCQGCVYAVTQEVYNWETGDFEDCEGYCGYMSDKYGDDLFGEIAGTDNLYKDFSALYKGVA